MRALADGFGELPIPLPFIGLGGGSLQNFDGEGYLLPGFLGKSFGLKHFWLYLKQSI